MRSGPMRVIAVVNMKGGVGKTSTVVSLADSLGTSTDQAVLVIDVDTQASASYSLVGDRLRDIIGKGSATQRGTPFAPGTQGEATVAALRECTSNNGEGLILVLEADIVSSVAKGDEYLVDIVANKTAKTIVQKPGTRVSSVFMLNKHKAAPGAAKAMLLSIIGENEATLTPESWSDIVQTAKVEDGKALKGVRFGFDTYAHKTKEGKTISLVRYSHIEQTDEEITKAANG